MYEQTMTEREVCDAEQYGRATDYAQNAEAPRRKFRDGYFQRREVHTLQNGNDSDH